MVMPKDKNKMNIAISGAGRIGRAVFRAFYENKERYSALNLVAMNDPHDFSTLAYLLKYDSVHGQMRVPFSLQNGPDRLDVAGESVLLYGSRSPLDLPWKDLNIDGVLECSGCFKTRAGMQQHVQAGARKVLLSAPSSEPLDRTIVLGANDQDLSYEHNLISIGSCTTNALAPILSMLQSMVVVENCFFTTVHAYTKDQALVDSHHRDLRRGRAACQSIVPTKTGASKAIAEVLPGFLGKLEGYALRVPTANVSLLDLVVELQSPIEKKDLECKVKAYVDQSAVLSVTDEPLVSCDFNQNPASAVIDLTQIQVNGRMLRLVAWYDNEWAYAMRMLDVASKIAVMSSSACVI